MWFSSNFLTPSLELHWTFIHSLFFLALVEEISLSPSQDFFSSLCVPIPPHSTFPGALSHRLPPSHISCWRKWCFSFFFFFWAQYLYTQCRKLGRYRKEQRWMQKPPTISYNREKHIWFLIKKKKFLFILIPSPQPENMFSSSLVSPLGFPILVSGVILFILISFI